MFSTDYRRQDLKRERDHLLKAWLSAEGSNKTSILIRIDDIDDQLREFGEQPKPKAIRKRKFIRR